MKSGIYVVELLNTTPIFTNAQDRRPNRQGTPVQKGHVKCGKAKDLDRRQRNYQTTFGATNFNFYVVYETKEIDRFEKAILKEISRFRELGRQGRKLEWLQGISAKELILLINHIIKEESLIKSDYIVLNNRPSWEVMDGHYETHRVNTCLYGCGQHWDNLKKTRNSNERLCNICNSNINETSCKFIGRDTYEQDVLYFHREYRRFIYKNKLHMFYDRQIRHRVLLLFGINEYKDL